jgi:hypothetical protein
MRAVLVAAWVAAGARPAAAQVTSVTFPAQVFRPPAATIAASQVELRVNVDAVPGEYEARVTRFPAGSVAAVERIRKTTPLGTPTLFRLPAPLDEGSNRFTVQVTALSGAGFAASGATPAVVRELKNGVSRVTLDAVVPSVRATSAVNADLIFTVSGTAGTYLVTAVNAFAATPVTTTLGRTGEGFVRVPLTANSPNVFTLTASPNDPPFAAPGPATSDNLAIVQDSVLPVVTGASIPFPPLPTGDTVVSVTGQTEPFADVAVDNGAGGRSAGQADILGTFLIHGVVLPLVPPGPTVTSLSVRARDSAGNLGPAAVLTATRTAADPRFDRLSITPASGQQLFDGRAAVVSGQVGARTAPYTVRFTVRAGAGSFAADETLQLLNNGDSFAKDVFLSPLISNPNADVVYSVAAQVTSTGGQTNAQLVGEVTLDAVPPPPAGLATRFDPRVFTRARLVTVDGTAERFAGVDFTPADGMRFPLGRRAKVDSTPAVDGGEFRQLLDLSVMADGDYSVPVTVIATSGLTGPGSVRELAITRDTRPPLVTALEIDGTASRGNRPVYLRAGTVVTIRVFVNEPMSRAPDVFVTERGLDALPAPLSTARPGNRVFEYAYVVTPNPPVIGSGDDLSDGAAEVVVTGGADLAGNPVEPEARFLGAFFKDSLAPVVEIARVRPPSGSPVSTAPDPLSITVVEPALSVPPPSGVDMSRLTVEAFGPIETSPTTPRAGTIEPLAPQTVLFRFAPGQFVAEGTYRFVVTAQDFAGNRDTTTLLLLLDTTPIPARFLTATSPPNLACVNRSSMPTDAANRDFVSATFSPDILSQLDLAGTTMALSIACPRRARISGTTQPVTPSQVRFVLGDKLRPGSPADVSGTGVDDGVYVIDIFIRDRAGNITPGVFRTFTYDTTPPFVLDGTSRSVGGFGITTENTFFPGTDGIANGPLRQVRAGLADGIAENTFSGCGINTSVTTGSQLVLTLVGAFPTTTLPVGSSTANSPQLSSITRFASIEPRNTSPCFAGVRRANVLLELRVDPVSAAPIGLATGGSMDGIWELTATPVDGAGNRGEIVRSRFIYDTLPPTLSLDSVTADQFITSNTLSLTGITFDERKPPRDFGLGVNRVAVRVEQATSTGVTTRPPLIDWTIAELPPNARLTDASTPLRWVFRGVLPRYVGRARLVVRATDSAGNVTDLLRDLNVMTDLLPAPRLRTPTDGSAVASQIVTLTWSQVVGASRYRVTLTDPAGNRIATETAPAFNGATVSLVDRPQGVYSWIVQAVDTQGVLGSAPFAFRFTLDTVPPRVLNLFGFDPVLPDAHQGPVLDGQVRVGIRFSEDMDEATTPTVRVRPANPAAPELTLAQIHYERDQWRGLVRLPPDPAAPDVNGLARVSVAGARDRAGNPLPLSFDFFEVAIGPFFEIRAFASPINRREILFHFKALRNQDGPVETLTAPPTARVTQRTGTPRLLVLRKVRASVWAGPYALDPTRPGTATIEVNGTDLVGNAATRVVAFDIQTVVGRARAGLALPGSPLAIDVPSGALADGESLALVPPALANAGEAGDELVPVAPLGAILPPLDLAVEAEARVDLSRVSLPDGLARERVGLYRIGTGAPEFLAGRTAGDLLVARAPALAALALMADVRPPAIDHGLATAPDGTVRIEGDVPELAVIVSDAGSGVDPASVLCEVDGRAWPGRREPAPGAWVHRGPASLAGGAHRVRLAARDRAGNAAERSFAAVAPEAFAIRELVPYPNPCRTATRLRYRLTRDARECRIAIFDVSGRTVTTLAGPTPSGANDVAWDLTDSGGSPVASGVYIARLRARGLAGDVLRRDTKIAVLR